MQNFQAAPASIRADNNTKATIRYKVVYIFIPHAESPFLTVCVCVCCARSFYNLIVIGETRLLQLHLVCARKAANTNAKGREQENIRSTSLSYREEFESKVAPIRGNNLSRWRVDFELESVCVNLSHLKQLTRILSADTESNKYRRLVRGNS